MNQRHLIEVDPQRIKFNPLNPRRHRGTEYVRLRESIKKIGIVQLPTVRTIPGGFYEVIDGEGRVSIAQEEKFEKVWVVSVGQVTDEDALVMLQTANTTRSFNFLAECKGLANMHRQGKSSRVLASQFRRDEGTMARMIAIGYLPAGVTSSIEDDINRSEERASIWAPEVFKHILLLRELLPGKSVQKAVSEDLSNTDAGSLDGLYDYTEIEKAVKWVISRKDATTGKDMHNYVIGRRWEIQQARFNQDLKKKLEDELAIAKEDLEKVKAGEVKEAEDKTKQRYEGQVNTLQTQLREHERRNKQVANDLAKYPEIIKQRERDLEAQIQAEEDERKRLEEERKRLEEERKRLEKEAQENQERLRSEAGQRLKEDLERQRKEQEEKLKETEESIRSLYAQKDQERQFKAENTIRGLLSNGVRRMAEAQQTLEHTVSPDMLQGVLQLGGTQLNSLLAQAESLRETLGRVEEKLTQGDCLVLAERVIVNGYKAQE